MSTYLLLRDNKQSGPYTFDELKRKGLKAYDLVWVEGKSAAWRYPGEVEELKSFAPIVEEQPFDRFFKKPSKTAETAAAGSAATIQSSASEELVSVQSTIPTREPVIIKDPAPPAREAARQEENPIPGRKTIYVTMPGGRAPVRKESFSSETTRPQTSEAVSESNASRPSQEDRSPVVATRAISTPPAGWTDASAPLAAGGTGLFSGNIEENISHSVLPEKSPFVEKRPQSFAGRGISRMGKPLAIGMGVVALIAAGILIGLSLNSSRNGNLLSRGETAAANPQDHTTNPVPVFTTAITSPGQKTDNSAGLTNPVITDPSKPQEAGKEGEGLTRKKGMTAKEKAAASAAMKNQPALAPKADSASELVIPVTREASHRTEEAGEKDALRNNVVNQVSVGTNKYNVGTFGGISELQLTVSNRSIYPLDLVVVEVQYVQANKKLYKTENLYFRGIGAGSALMQEAPKSSRGIKVQYRIILINSKELGLSYSGI